MNDFFLKKFLIELKNDKADHYKSDEDDVISLGSQKLNS